LVEETGGQGQNHLISYARGLEVLSVRIINNIFSFISVHLYFAKLKINKINKYNSKNKVVIKAT
jgi:hypothetical protein